MRTTGDIERATCSAAHAERFAAGFVLPAHGYESDVAALRAIVSLYSEAALDARRDYFAKSTADLLDWQGKLADAADKLGSAWAWATIRAGSLEEQLAHLGDTYGNAAAADSDEHEAWAVRRAAWLRLVANDVRARLAGAMGRPLPTRSLKRMGSRNDWTFSWWRLPGQPTLVRQPSSCYDPRAVTWPSSELMSDVTRSSSEAGGSIVSTCVT